MSENINSLSTKKNVVFNWGIQILSYIVPLFTAPYIARVLQPAGVGIFSFTSSILNYFIIFVAYGFGDFGVMLIAKNRGNKGDWRQNFWSVFFAKIFIFAFASSIYFILALNGGFGNSDYSLYYIILYLSLAGTAFDISFLFKGFENYRLVLIINVFTKIISAVSIFMFVRNESSLWVYYLISSFTVFLNSFLLWPFAVKFIGRPQFKPSQVILMIKKATPYFAPTVATTIVNIADVTILGLISDVNEVAYFEQALKIKNLVMGVIIAVSPIMIARITFLRHAELLGEVRKKFIQLADLYALLAFPSFWGLMAISRFFIPAFFGDMYLNSVPIMYWLNPTLLLAPLSYALVCSYFMPYGKINYITAFEFVIAAINVIGNITILKFTNLGGVGIAITSLISEVIMACLTIKFSWKSIPGWDMLKIMIKPFIASMAMFCVVCLFNSHIGNTIKSNIIITIVDVAIGGISYSLLLLLLKDQLVLKTLTSMTEKFLKK